MVERTAQAAWCRARSAGGNPDRIRVAASGISGHSTRRHVDTASRDAEVTVLPDLPSIHAGNGHGEAGRADDPQELAIPKANGWGGGHRVTITWKKAFAAGLLCFCVWLVLDGPTLMKNAEGSPLGTRRTVAMDVLRPIAWLSRSTGLSHIVGATDTALGRNGNGVVSVSSGPSPGVISQTTTTAPPPTTVTTKPNGSTSPKPKPVLLADGWPPFGPISAASPLRVLVVGDSVGTDLGQYTLVDDLGSTGVVSATLDGQISTGLTRPDYFNWPAELSTDLGKLHPQLVIICLGANDAQNEIVNNQVLVYGTQAWDNMYSSRIGTFINEATSTGARVLWVGMPPMASSQLNAQMQHLDYLYQTQVSRHPGSFYMSSVPALGGPGGIYESIKSVDGSSEEIRTDDGIHLQPAGAQLLSVAVIEEMDHVYRLSLTP